MENKRNYQLELEKITEQCKLNNARPKLLLHVCCAPCSSYCITYLAEFFDIIAYFYNPNITSISEYEKRRDEFMRFVEKSLPDGFGINIEAIYKPYDSKPFLEMAKGLEDVPEGGERCFKCYRLRMEEAVKEAKELGCDYFTTSLSISPLKNAVKINEIGEELAGIYGVSHLPSDFKKKDGYKKSIELSHEYNLYRQDYCGCVYSQMERKQGNAVNKM